MELAVQASGLRKRFGRNEALRGVDLEVAPGTVCGLLGPNGAGKTTVVRVLTTLLRPDAGSARVAGHDVLREPDRVRFRIGLAGQRTRAWQTDLDIQRGFLVGCTWQKLDFSFYVFNPDRSHPTLVFTVGKEF